jgi:hypothetical protein
MRTVAIIAALILLAPDTSLACSVCFGGEDQSRSAFIVTTVLLSALPLAFIASVALWVRSRAKALEARRRAHLWEQV